MVVERLFVGMGSMDIFGLTQTIFAFRSYLLTHDGVTKPEINDGIMVTMDYPTF